MAKSARRCILNPTHALRGWLMLAYGVQQRDSTVTKFMPKLDYAFLLDRDGGNGYPIRYHAGSGQSPLWLLGTGGRHAAV